MDEQPTVHPAVEATASDVATMEIRGAAPIAVAAASALATAATESDATGDELRAELRAAARRLHDTRPTAISLANAIRLVLGDLDPSVPIRTPGGQLRPVRRTDVAGGSGPSESDVASSDSAPDAESDAASDGEPNPDPGGESNAALDAPASQPDLDTWVASRATAFQEDLADAQSAVGRVGGNRFVDGDVVLTHCHSTAVLACFERALDRGIDLSAYVKETRPRLQGHETARDLEALGVDVTLVVDGAAHATLPAVDHVLVGADSIEADGTLVNKVGTAGLAASAAVRDVPVTVAATTLKLNPETLAGHVTPIEERSADEVIDPDRRRSIGDPSVANPAFDRTPPAHLDAVATEVGLLAPTNVGTLVREWYGATPVRPWERSCD